MKYLHLCVKKTDFLQAPLGSSWQAAPAHHLGVQLCSLTFFSLRASVVTHCKKQIWNIRIFVKMATVVRCVPPITFSSWNVHIIDLFWNSLIFHLGGILSPINLLFMLLVQQVVCHDYIFNYNQISCIFWPYFLCIYNHTWTIQLIILKCPYYPIVLKFLESFPNRIGTTFSHSVFFPIQHWPLATYVPIYRQ